MKLDIVAKGFHCEICKLTHYMQKIEEKCDKEEKKALEEVWNRMEDAETNLALLEYKQHFWVCAKLLEEYHGSTTGWSLEGVFTDKNKAVECCTTHNHYIFPISSNFHYKEDMEPPDVEWPFYTKNNLTPEKNVV